MAAPNQITVFDRALVRAHRNRAAAGFAAHSALFEETAAQIIERLAGIKQEFHTALDLGAHNGYLTQRLIERDIPFVAAADISEKMMRQAKTHRIVADEEFLPFAPGSFDLIVSNLSLHWVNDLPGALLQIKNALRPGGLFLAALIGGNSLHELRSCIMDAELAAMSGVSPRLSPTIEMQTASALLQRAGFALPVTDMETITLTYADAFALMRDVRGMGETNAHLHRLRHPARRQIFVEAAKLYRERFSDAENRILATFDILYLHGVNR